MPESPSPPSTSSSPESPDTGKSLVVVWYKNPTFLTTLRAIAINFLLPFINGIMLGFGEICANEITFKYGWLGANIVSAGGRSTIPLGLRGAPPEHIEKYKEITGKTNKKID